MTEQLGEAVLVLRTDDSGLDKGIAGAEGKARALGGAFDKTGASAVGMSRGLSTAGKTAVVAGGQFQQAGARVGASAASQAMGMRQLSMNLSDATTMYSMGIKPMQIYASQIGQVIQSVQLMSGGTSKLAAFMSGPWGLAITMATLVLSPLIGKLFEADAAAKAAEEGADALGSAQSALGDVFDMVSGKLKTQNELLLLNARLMALNLRAEARVKAASSRETFREAGTRPAPSALEAQTMGIAGLGPTAGGRNATRIRAVLNAVSHGSLSRDAALKRTETLNFEGVNVTRQELQQAIIDSAVAEIDVRVADLIDQSLDSGSLAPGLRQPGRTKKPAKGKTGPDAEDIQRRYDADEMALIQQILSARQQLAGSAEERADLEWKSVEWTRRQALNEIAANEDYTEAQKAELSAKVTLLADFEIEGIDQRKRTSLEREAQQLADEQYQAAQDSLRVQLDLADTEGERKALALQIFDAETAHLRSKLEAVTLSETANDIDKQSAQLALDALNATAGARREGVARGNETEVERYLRGLNRSPGQINEAIDGIKIDGLEELNDGLVDAIMGAKSLGEVFHNVAGQIVADLLRIGIQRAVIAPLADMLFGGGGGGGGGSGGGLVGSIIGGLIGAAGGGGGGAPANLLGGTPFAGFRAKGGLIPSGSFGIVGERGPEPVIGTSRGAMVLPNSSLGGFGGAGGTVRVIIEDATDLFRTKVEQISGDVAAQTVRAVAPTIRDVAVSEAVRQITRPRMS